MSQEDGYLQLCVVYLSVCVRSVSVCVCLLRSCFCFSRFPPFLSNGVFFYVCLLPPSLPPSLSSLSLLPFPHLLAQTRGQLWTESRPAVCLCVCVRVHVWEIICGSRECSLQVRLDSNTKDMLYNGCAEFKFWVATFVVSLKSDRPPRRHSYYKMLKKGLTSWELI